MAETLTELVAKIKVDSAELKKGLADGEKAIDATGKTLEKKIGDWANKYSKELRGVGVAFTAIGAAGMKMVDTSKELNAQLGATGITIGKSTKEMRDLALSTTDVTFPLESVTKTFELLSKAGVRNTAQMKSSAKAFDALADATGSSADAVADLLLPAFKLFGQAIPTTSRELDKFTWLTKNTLVDLNDFGTLLTRMAPYMDKLNLSMDDAIVTLAALSEQGITGTAATLKLRTAITQAASEGKELKDVLGITNEEMGKYRQQMEGAVGITDTYAAQLNTQFTLLDKLKQKLSEITLSASGFLEPLEPILAAMTALGPAMIFLSTSMGKATLSFIAAKAAMLGPYGLLAALAAVLIGVAIQQANLNWNIGEFVQKANETTPAIQKLIDGQNDLRDATKETNDSIKAQGIASAFAKIEFANATKETLRFGNAQKEFKTAVGDTNTYVNLLADTLNASKIALANATWAYEGITYRIQLYTEADIKAAEAAGKLVERIDPETVKALQKAEKEFQDQQRAMEETRQVQENLSRSFQNLMDRIYYADSAAGKFNITMYDVYDALDANGFKADEIRNLYAKYGEEVSSVNLILAELGLTANNINDILGKQTVSVDGVTKSLGPYAEAMAKAGMNTTGMVTAAGQPSQAFEDWTYLTQRPEYRASEEYQKAQAEMQRVESELGPEETFSPIGILVAYAQEWAKKVGATFERGNWQIPEFQSGGIMPSTGLAMVHGGETIIPANESMGNITIQFTQPVFFDREDTMIRFVDKIRKEIQRQDRLRFGRAYSGG